jgi:hypothetical protein
MKYLENYKEAYRANKLMYEAMKFARTFEGSSSELEKALKEEFPEIGAVVRQELALLYIYRNENY